MKDTNNAHICHCVSEVRPLKFSHSIIVRPTLTLCFHIRPCLSSDLFSIKHLFAFRIAPMRATPPPISSPLLSTHEYNYYLTNTNYGVPQRALFSNLPFTHGDLVTRRAMGPCGCTPTLQRHILPPSSGLSMKARTPTAVVKIPNSLAISSPLGPSTTLNIQTGPKAG
jgi:hypothetical protein